MTVAKFRRSLQVDGESGLRPESAVDPAESGRLRIPQVRMAETPIFQACPRCGFEWRSLPAPAPMLGLQPTFHKCLGCKRWWVVVYRVSAVPRIRLRIFRVVESYGRQAGSVRQALAQVPELDEDLINLTVAVSSLQPDPES